MNAHAAPAAKRLCDDVGHRRLGVTLDAAFYLARAAAPHMAKGGKGRIIHIGGATAFTGADEHAHVVAAKAGSVWIGLGSWAATA